MFAAFLAVGVVLLPILIFLVGKGVFGPYEGDGFGGFYGTLGSKLGSGDWVAWFLVLSPYLGVQCLRLTAKLWRIAGNSPPAN